MVPPPEEETALNLPWDRLRGPAEAFQSPLRARLSMPTAQKVDAGHPVRDRMLAYLDGDERAGVLWVRRIRPDLLRLARRHVATEAQAEDLVQEILLRVHERRDLFDRERLHSDAAVFAWFRVTLRNRAIDHARSAAAGRKSYERAAREGGSDTRTPEECLSDAEVADLAKEAVREAVTRLPDSQREVIARHRLEGRPLRQVAGELRVSYAAAKVRAHRGYASLRDLMDPSVAAVFAT